MKTRAASDHSACNTPAHAYLGHFGKAKHINAGHNTVVDGASKVIETVGKALGTERGKAITAGEKAVAPETKSGDKTMRRKVIDKAVEGE